MKKTLLTLILITLIAGVLKAQDRATRWDEYNYLKQGNYNLILPGHSLRASNIDITVPFTFTGSRRCQIYELTGMAAAHLALLYSFYMLMAAITAYPYPI